jgi:exopolyphosphatase/guanosine-5'-triphosphate,3'-diphosphate pyrophosphatase
MARADLRRAVDRLAGLPVSERAALPGISAARAGQSLAGAIVAHTTLKLMGINEVTICPWALREGVLLRCIEDGNADWWDGTAPGLREQDANATPPRLLRPVGQDEIASAAASSSHLPGGVGSGR